MNDGQEQCMVLSIGGFTCKPKAPLRVMDMLGCKLLFSIGLGRDQSVYVRPLINEEYIAATTSPDAPPQLHTCQPTGNYKLSLHSSGVVNLSLGGAPSVRLCDSAGSSRKLPRHAVTIAVNENSRFESFTDDEINAKKGYTFPSMWLDRSRPALFSVFMDEQAPIGKPKVPGFGAMTSIRLDFGGKRDYSCHLVSWQCQSIGKTPGDIGIRWGEDYLDECISDQSEVQS